MRPACIHTHAAHALIRAVLMLPGWLRGLAAPIEERPATLTKGSGVRERQDFDVDIQKENIAAREKRRREKAYDMKDSIPETPFGSEVIKVRGDGPSDAKRPDFTLLYPDPHGYQEQGRVGYEYESDEELKPKTYDSDGNELWEDDS